MHCSNLTRTQNVGRVDAISNHHEATGRMRPESTESYPGIGFIPPSLLIKNHRKVGKGGTHARGAFHIA